MTKSKQTTDGSEYDEMEYSYNLSGGLIETKYPSGRVVKNVPEGNVVHRTVLAANAQPLGGSGKPDAKRPFWRAARLALDRCGVTIGCLF